MVRQVAYVHGQRIHYIEQNGKNYTLAVILSLFALNSHLSAPNLMLYILSLPSLFIHKGVGGRAFILDFWHGWWPPSLTWLVALVGCLPLLTWGSPLSHGVTSRICRRVWRLLGSVFAVLDSSRGVLPPGMVKSGFWALRNLGTFGKNSIFRNPSSDTNCWGSGAHQGTQTSNNTQVLTWFGKSPTSTGSGFTI